MFSRQILERFDNPGKTGPLTGATHVGVAGEPGNGPSMQFWFVVGEGCVTDASFETFPCPAAIACGSLLAELALGRRLDTISAISERDLTLILGGIPEGKEHCPHLAVDALRALRPCDTASDIRDYGESEVGLTEQCQDRARDTV